MASMKEVIVIGSGISGLATAYRLKKQGVDVAIYEKEEDTGGNIKTLEENGYLLELGPQTVLADQKVTEFFEEVGISPITANPSSKNRYIYKKGSLIPLPLNPISFLTSPLLSIKAKLKVLREPWASPPIKSEESVADFVRRRLGEEFLKYVVAPFISGVYAGDPEALSVRWATPKIHRLEAEFGSLIKGAVKKKALGPGGKLISFKKGLKELTDKLANSLDVKTQNVVLRIRRKDDRFVLDTREGKVEARAVVVSSPAYTASYLLKDLSWSASLDFDSIDYVPVVVVHSSVLAGSVPDGFGFLVPRDQGIRMLGTIFSSKLFPERSPEGKELLTTYLGGATDREVIKLSNNEIADTVRSEIKKILGCDADVLKITKWKRAIPQYMVGYGKFVDLAKELEETHRGLFLTGNYLGGISVADCIRHSEDTAERVINFLES